MSKEKNKQSHIEIMNIKDVLSENYMPYAASVIVNRALPAIDGFKPSHRKVLYTMYKMGLLSNNLTKSSNAVGEIMKLHPHGDTTIYETIVRMTNSNEALRYPYIIGKGSFGKHYSSEISYAAHRYTEVKLDPYCEILFNDINKDVVNFSENFDNTMLEPDVLPTMYPNILTTNTDGIAVAMASTICSFNIIEICNYTKAWIRSKTKRINPLVHISGPDLPYGGVFIDDGKSLEKVLKTGRGSLKIRGKYYIDKKKREIVFTEIPYTTTVEEIMKDISKNAQGNINNKNNHMPAIREVRDDIDRKGLKFVVGYKQGYDVDELLEQLFYYTKLEDSIHCNFNILTSEGYPKVMGVNEIVEEWYNLRFDVIKRRIKYDLEKVEKELFLISGLIKIKDHLEDIISIVKSSKNKKTSFNKIKKKYKLEDEQVNYILSIQLGNLNKEYLNKQIKDLEQLQKESKNMNKILKSKELIDKEIIKDINYVVRKYGDDKRTSVVLEEDITYYNPEAITEDYTNYVYITDDNYVKKIPEDEYKSDKENIFKDGDSIKDTFILNNSSELIALTNKGNAYKTILEDIKDSKMNDIGEYAYNIFNLKKNEEILYIFGSNNFDESLLIIYENGTGIRVSLKSFQTKTNRSVLRNSLDVSEKPFFISVLDDNSNLVINAKSGGGILLDTDIIPERKNRGAKGIRVLNISKDDIVSHVEIIKQPNKLENIRISEIPSRPIK